MELYDYTPEGEPILRSQNELSLPLSTRVQRLWATHPDFAALTEANAVAGSSKTEEKEDGNEDNDQQKKAGELTTEQCQELKESMIQKLSVAHNELFFLLNVINATVPMQLKPNEQPPPLPLGQAGETIKASSLGKGALPPPTLPTQAHDASLSTARKSAAISKASKSLAAASQRLSATAEQSAKDWAVFSQWKRDGWTLQTRGSGPGASFSNARGLEQCAKELVAVVACEESPAPLRSTVAYLKQDQEVDMVKLKHGKRRMVLRFCAGPGSHEEVYVASATDLDLMHQGQIELFEEDLFREIMKEAQRHQPSGPSAEERLFRGTTLQHQVRAELAPDGWMSIEMVPHDEVPTEPSGKYARLASGLLRLRMTTLMQHRRRMATQATPAMQLQPPAVTASTRSNPVSVLLWVVDLLTIVLRVLQLRPYLGAQCDTLVGRLSEKALEEVMDGSGQASQLGKLDGLLHGAVQTEGGKLRMSWSGTDLWLSTKHGHVPLHNVSQLQEMLALQ